MLQVRKVMEHVYEKIINLDNESQAGGTTNDKPSEQKEDEDMAVLAEEKIELLCQDQVHLYYLPCVCLCCYLKSMCGLRLTTWPKRALLSTNRM